MIKTQLDQVSYLFEQLNVDNVDTEIDDEKEPNAFFAKEMKSYVFHSRYFYPNVCHLCSSPANKNSDHYPDEIIRCDKCYMIAYCGELHQNQHMPQHQELCSEIQKLLDIKRSTNLFDFIKFTTDSDERLKQKYKLISTVEKGLKRPLHPEEKQMFLHPRICCVCFESDPDELVDCKFCPQASFCKNHINDETHKGELLCMNYNYCFDLDYCCVLDDRYNVCVNTKNFPFSSPDPETLPLSENMEKLLLYVDKNGPTTPIMNVLGAYLWTGIWSKLYSNILTLVHVIKKFNFESELNIHIVGTKISREEFALYELILHLFPKLRFLKIYIVGEELEQSDSFFVHQIGVCEKCEKEGKLLLVNSIKVPYARYIEMGAFFQAPDFIITYNCGESKVHMWAESLSKMVNILGPFVMTVSSKLRARTEHKKMTEIFGALGRDKFWFEKNPYPSQRPYRDAQDDGLKFNNSIIGFYTLYGATVSLSDKGTAETSEASSTEEQSEEFEVKEESKIETTGATEATDATKATDLKEATGATEATEVQTSKSDPNLQKGQSESEVQVQKEGSSKSKKKKNKKSKAQKSSEQSVDETKELKRKLYELLQENSDLKNVIPDVKAKFPEYKKMTELQALNLLEEIFVLKACLDDNISKLLESLNPDNEL